jgi:hypothetical protein
MHLLHIFYFPIHSMLFSYGFVGSQRSSNFVKISSSSHFLAGTALMSLAFTSLVLAQELPAPRSPNMSKAPASLPEKHDVTIQNLAAATQRALSGLRGNGLKIFKQNVERWEEWREAVFSTPSATPRRAADLNEVEITEWQDQVKRRTSWIHGLMDYRQDKDLTGFWSDGAGGHCSLVEVENKIHFLASCVRGETRHLGAVQGIAVRSGKMALFLISEYDGEPTQLEFIFEKPWLVLKGTHTGPYHGNRAYFDGHYAKIAPLSKDEKKVVLQATQKQ